VVVDINIMVNQLRSLEMLHRVERSALLQLGRQVELRLEEYDSV